jgi:hypothetical protein
VISEGTHYHAAAAAGGIELVRVTGMRQAH